MMTEIREPLITTTITNLTPATFASSVGRVYLSTPMIPNQEDAVKIIDAWQSVHVPTLGSLIPQTTAIHSIAGTALIPTTSAIHSKVGEAGIVTIFTPTANKSYALYTADITNAGGAPLSVQFGVTDGTGKFVMMGVQADVAPTTVIGVTWYAQVFFDSSVYPAFKVISGTVGDVSVQISVGEVVQ